MKQIMVDIETLGTKPGCIILSIGAAEFDINTGQVGKTFYVNINPISSQKSGLSIDASTVMWWMDQDKQAVEKLQQQMVSLSVGIHSLETWFIELDDYSEIWANSPSFDLSILKHVFELLTIECPWKFWQERDCRTLDSLMPYIRKSIINDLPHDALSDCLYQIKYISQIYKTINK